MKTFCWSDTICGISDQDGYLTDIRDDSPFNYLVFVYSGLVIMAQLLYWLGYLETVLGWIVNVEAIRAAVNHYIDNSLPESQAQDSLDDTAPAPDPDVADEDTAVEELPPPSKLLKEFAWERKRCQRHDRILQQLRPLTDEERGEVYDFVKARKPRAQREKEAREAYEASLERIAARYHVEEAPAPLADPAPILTPAQMAAGYDEAIGRFIAGMRHPGVENPPIDWKEDLRIYSSVQRPEDIEAYNERMLRANNGFVPAEGGSWWEARLSRQS